MQNNKFRFFIILLSVFTGLGIVASIVYAKQYKPYSCEEILKQVKAQFNNVEASYISHIPKTYQKFGIETKVVHGGITVNNDGKQVHYEFIADAFNGQVIDIFEI